MLTTQPDTPEIEIWLFQYIVWEFIRPKIGYELF